MNFERQFIGGLSTFALAIGVWGLIDGQDLATLLRGGFFAVLGATGLTVHVLRAMRGDVGCIRWSVDRAVDTYLRKPEHDGTDAPPPPVARSPGELQARMALPLIERGDPWRD